MATRVPSALPLSAENAALIRQHVPERVLSWLGDWTRTIPLVECVVRKKALTQVPDELHNKLFFTHRFEDSRTTEDHPSVAEGVALTFFQRGTRAVVENEWDGISIYNCINGRHVIESHGFGWSVFNCAFENGQPVGYYFDEAPTKYSQPEVHLYRDAHPPLRDAFTLYWEWEEDHWPEMVVQQKVPLVLRGAADAFAIVLSPEVPVPLDLNVLREQQQLARQVPEPWYIRIPLVFIFRLANLLGHCLRPLVHCIRYLFQIGR